MRPLAESREYCDGTNVYTVEGNTSQAAGLNANGGGVYYKSYALSNTRIRGYGALPYKTNAYAIKPDYSCKNITTGLYINTNYQNSGIAKRTYKDAACNKTGPDIALNEMFEVVEFVSPNVAKCVFYRTNPQINAFTTAEGYIKFDDGAKLVQVLSYGEKYEENQTPVDPPVDDPVNPPVDDPVEPPVDPTTNTFVPVAEGNQYVAHAITTYTVNGEAKGTANSSFEID